MLQTKKKSSLGTLENAQELIEVKPPNPWPNRIAKWLPWIIIWLSIQGVGGKVNKLLAQYTDPPVLVQVGASGKPIMARQIAEGHLNPNNINSFAHEVVPLLWRLNARLPEELGGGEDPGVMLEKTRVPTPMFMARAALSDETADGFLKGAIKTGPKDLWKGAAQSISQLQVGEPTSVPNNPDLRKIVVTGVLQTDNPDGSPRSAQRWARTLTVRAIQKPRFLLKKSAIEEKYNLFLKRGLLITKIKDATEILP